MVDVSSLRPPLRSCSVCRMGGAGIDGSRSASRQMCDDDDDDDDDDDHDDDADSRTAAESSRRDPLHLIVGPRRRDASPYGLGVVATHICRSAHAMATRTHVARPAVRVGWKSAKRPNNSIV
uniref:Uncharacterized protein n=1 Tax=Odontella aurita TaxID=265563 RepID=A0A7S4JCW5_9STRA